MIIHLGNRVSALLDGQLPPAEAEEAWRHVYGCHACRDLVEREGWVKSRLADLQGSDSPVSHSLKGSLLTMTGPCLPVMPEPASASRKIAFGAAFVGGGAVGAALLGVVALGVAPGSTAGQPRPPVSQIRVAVTPSATDNGSRQRSKPTPPHNVGSGLIQVLDGPLR